MEDFEHRTIDSRTNVVMIGVYYEFRFVVGHFLPILTVGLEEVLVPGIQP